MTTRYVLPLGVRDGRRSARRARPGVHDPVARGAGPMRPLRRGRRSDLHRVAARRDSRAARAADIERDGALLLPGSRRARHRQPVVGAPSQGRAEQHVGRGGRRHLPQASAPRRAGTVAGARDVRCARRPPASRTSRRCSDARCWESGGEPPSPLVLVQRFLHNSTEGWALALTSLRDLYADAESIGHADPVGAPGRRGRAGRRVPRRVDAARQGDRRDAPRARAGAPGTRDGAGAADRGGAQHAGRTR